ncbi:unnamed protein product [Arctogadus glacialis]
MVRSEELLMQKEVPHQPLNNKSWTSVQNQCALQTINLISTSDVEKYLTSNAESKAVYRSSTAKYTAIWTKSSRSALASETVEELGVPCFKDKEYQFLHEYCTALTAALDILQGDCPYGILPPTLEVLMQKTLAVKDALSRLTAGLPNNIVQSPASVPTTSASQGEMDFFNFEAETEETTLQKRKSWTT